MKPTITVDTSQWQAAARELFQTSSRTCVNFTNGQALRVASWAIDDTEKANRQQIERVMGIISSVETRRSGRAGAKGWVRITKRKIAANSFAERIIAKRFQETGSWFGLKGKTIQAKAIRFVAAKVRSVAFIRSGWIPAVRTLSALVYKKPRGVKGTIGDTRIKGQPKGFAIPARFSLRSKIVATIGNTALRAVKFSTWHGKPGNPMPVAERGLRKAIARAAQDMIAKLAGDLNPDLKKVSAK